MAGWRPAVGEERGSGAKGGEGKKEGAHEHPREQRNSLEWWMAERSSRGVLAVGADGGAVGASWLRRYSEGESEMVRN